MRSRVQVSLPLPKNQGVTEVCSSFSFSSCTQFAHNFPDFAGASTGQGCSSPGVVGYIGRGFPGVFRQKAGAATKAAPAIRSVGRPSVDQELQRLGNVGALVPVFVPYVGHGNGTAAGFGPVLDKGHITRVCNL